MRVERSRPLCERCHSVPFSAHRRQDKAVRRRSLLRLRHIAAKWRTVFAFEPTLSFAAFSILSTKLRSLDHRGMRTTHLDQIRVSRLPEAPHKWLRPGQTASMGHIPVIPSIHCRIPCDAHHPKSAPISFTAILHDVRKSASTFRCRASNGQRTLE